MDIEMGIDLREQKYCCALLCIENGKEKFCGDIVMGKVRYCARHSHNTGLSNKGDNNGN